MSEQQPEHKPGIGSVIMSTLAAAMGVQSSKNRERDFAKGNFKMYVVSGIIFTVLFSLDSSVDFGGHLGGFIGGYFSGIMLFPGIRPKNNYLTLAGAGALAAYFLVMFLVFFLA